MAHGGKREGAGRKKTSINKVKLDVTAILQQENVNPVLELLDIAKKAKRGINVITKDGVDRIPDYNLAARIYSDLLTYSATKLKAIEHSGPEQGPIEVDQEMRVVFVNPPKYED
jgi:hypothetical protein